MSGTKLFAALAILTAGLFLTSQAFALGGTSGGASSGTGAGFGTGQGSSSMQSPSGTNGTGTYVNPNAGVNQGTTPNSSGTFQGQSTGTFGSPGTGGGMSGGAGK